MNIDRIKYGSGKFNQVVAAIRQDGIEVNDIVRRAKEGVDGSRTNQLRRYIEKERNLILADELPLIMKNLEVDDFEFPEKNSFATSVLATLATALGISIFLLIIIGIVSQGSYLQWLPTIAIVSVGCAIYLMGRSKDDEVSKKVLCAFYTGLIVEGTTPSMKNYDKALAKVDPDYRIKTSYISSILE